MMGFKNDLNFFPRPMVHLVREMNRKGFGVFPMTGEQEMSANDVKGLAQIVTEEVSRIRDRARKAGEDLQGHAKRADQIVSHVEEMNEELGTALDDLSKALGQTSNMPPKDQK